MAALTQTSLQGNGVRTSTPNTLTSSDTFTYSKGSNQILHILNGSGSAKTINLVGSAAVSTIESQGGTVNYAAGYSTGSVANGAEVVIPLDSIFGYLAGGTVTVTGGTGATARLMGY